MAIRITMRPTRLLGNILDLHPCSHIVVGACTSINHQKNTYTCFHLARMRRRREIDAVPYRFQTALSPAYSLLGVIIHWTSPVRAHMFIAHCSTPTGFAQHIKTTRLYPPMEYSRVTAHGTTVRCRFGMRDMPVSAPVSRHRLEPGYSGREA
jgi:hypothetical protein